MGRVTVRRAVVKVSASGQQRQRLAGHAGWVYGVSEVTVDELTFLASASGDVTVRIWDLTAGTEHRRLTGHTAEVYGVQAVTLEGRPLLASAGSDSTVQPISRACAASISELVSTSSPGAGSDPSGRTSSPVGITITCGARRTVSAVWPAAPAAARSAGRSR